MYLDINKIPSCECSTCHFLNAQETHFKPSSLAHCRVCAYMQKKGLRDDAEEHEDILDILPQPPAGEPIMPVGTFPKRQGWVDNKADHPTCAIAGCCCAVPKGAGGRHHKSRVCDAHRAAPRVWVVTPTCMYAKRWCGGCKAWKLLSAWSDPAAVTCDGCADHNAARRAKRAAAAAGVVAVRNAPAQHVYRGQDPPPNTQWLLLKTHTGPPDQCRVLGCTHHCGSVKSQACSGHSVQTLFRECCASQEPLVRFCTSCQQFRPAAGYHADGRCSDTCSALRSLGLRAPQRVNPDAVRVARAISLRSIPLPESTAAIARDLSIAELDDAVPGGGLCRYVAKPGCKRAHGGHRSRMCTTHRGKVVVRRTDKEVVCYCSGCKDLVGLDLAPDGTCSACMRVREGHDRARNEASDAGPSAPARQKATAGSQDSECAMLPASCSRDATAAHNAAQRRSLQAADSAADHTALVPATADAAAATTDDIGAAMDGEAVQCKGGGCARNLRVGSALGGYCIGCIVTQLCQACTLDIAVLATYPRSVRGSTGMSRSAGSAYQPCPQDSCAYVSVFTTLHRCCHSDPHICASQLC